MTLPLAVENPRWLGPCGCEMSIDGPAYPVCPRHGVRARIVTGDNLTTYVGTPPERMTRAEAGYAARFEGWVEARDILRGLVERLDAELAALPADAELGDRLGLVERSERLRRTVLAATRKAMSVATSMGFWAGEIDRVEREAMAAGVAVDAAEWTTP